MGGHIILVSLSSSTAQTNKQRPPPSPTPFPVTCSESEDEPFHHHHRARKNYFSSGFLPLSLILNMKKKETEPNFRVTPEQIDSQLIWQLEFRYKYPCLHLMNDRLRSSPGTVVTKSLHDSYAFFFEPFVFVDSGHLRPLRRRPHAENYGQPIFLRQSLSRRGEERHRRGKAVVGW